MLDGLKHIAASYKKKGLVDTLINLSDQATKLHNAVNPVLMALSLEQGKLAMEFSGGDESDYDPSASLSTAVAASTKKMSANFGAETIAQLNDTLGEGLSNGESISELSDRVSSVYGEATSYRSDRVARTESLNAGNSATLDAFQQNPAVVAMTWFANPDACPYCADLDGTTVGLEDSFVSQGDSVDVGDDSYQADYGDVNTPPLHPNCACTIVPEIDTGTAGVGDNSDGSDSIDNSDDEE